jgi:UDP-N-acetylmuramyl pentapeptide phosphotransferase/UDP-N-acetylglucosamine-1-phosphate transferase
MASLVAAWLGLLEDVVGLPVLVRACAQLAIGLGLGLALCTYQNQPMVLSLLVGLAFAGYINVANFMDGVDGISALHGLIAGVHFGLVGWLLHQQWLSALGALIALVFTAFVPWNLARGGAFLGDVGSYLLGALVAGCAVAAFFLGAGALLAIAPLLVYLADTFTTLIRRALRRERLFEAHRSHIYQQLTALGLPHLASAAVVTLISITCSAAAFLARERPSLVLLAVSIILVALIGYLLLPSGLRARSGARVYRR